MKSSIYVDLNRSVKKCRKINYCQVVICYQFKVGRYLDWRPHMIFKSSSKISRLQAISTASWCQWMTDRNLSPAKKSFDKTSWHMLRLFLGLFLTWKSLSILLYSKFYSALKLYSISWWTHIFLIVLVFFPAKRIKFFVISLVVWIASKRK